MSKGKSAKPDITLKVSRYQEYGKETYCGFDVPRKEGDSIPECLEDMLNKLKHRRSGIEEIHSSGGNLEFYILSSPKELTFGEKFSWAILMKLASLKIDLSLEVHEPG